MLPLFSRSSEAFPRNRRNKNKHGAKTTLIRRRIVRMASTTYNKLPKHAITTISLYLKTKFRRFLTKKTYYKNFFFCEKGSLCDEFYASYFF